MTTTITGPKIKKYADHQKPPVTMGRFVASYRGVIDSSPPYQVTCDGDFFAMCGSRNDAICIAHAMHMIDRLAA